MSDATPRYGPASRQSADLAFAATDSVDRRPYTANYLFALSNRILTIENGFNLPAVDALKPFEKLID